MKSVIRVDPSLFPAPLAAPAGIYEAVERGVRNVLRRHWVPANRLHTASKLTELLADATERNEVFCELEIRFRLELEDQELIRLHTLGDLLNYVTRQRAGLVIFHP